MSEISVIMSLFLMFILVGADDKYYEPLGDRLLRNIIYAKPCGSDFNVGLDENHNKLIDACYSLRWIDKKLYGKRIKIYYLIQDDNKVVEQGCVCE